MYNTILLPVDLNEESSWKKALPTALELCKTFGAKLHVMTVVPDFGMAIVGSFFPEPRMERASRYATAGRSTVTMWKSEWRRCSTTRTRVGDSCW